MTLRSTCSAEKKVWLRWRQSVMAIWRPAASSTLGLRLSISSGLSTKSSIDCTSPSALKKSCASSSGMKMIEESYSDMPISKSPEIL